jgi:hypothetical protein
LAVAQAVSKGEASIVISAQAHFLRVGNNQAPFLARIDRARRLREAFPQSSRLRRAFLRAPMATPFRKYAG